MKIIREYHDDKLNLNIQIGDFMDEIRNLPEAPEPTYEELRDDPEWIQECYEEDLDSQAEFQDLR